jgi:hypothetical protein
LETNEAFNFSATSSSSKRFFLHIMAPISGTVVRLKERRLSSLLDFQTLLTPGNSPPAYRHAAEDTAISHVPIDWALYFSTAICLPLNFDFYELFNGKL